MYLSPRSPSSMSISSDLRLRVFRLRRWWFNSGLRRFSLTFFVTAGLFVWALYFLFTTCGNSKSRFHPRATKFSSGNFVKTYPQTGRVIANRGGSAYNVSSPVSTSLVFSFSPEVETYLKEAVYDPFDENIYVSLGPAIIENDDGSLLTVQRLWLSNYDVLFNKNPEVKTKNTWQENFLYKREFSDDWQPLERGHILGIPSGTNCNYAYRSDGPMDPRLFRWNDTIYLSFHLWQFDRDQNDIRGRMFMWHYEKNQLIKLDVPESFRARLQRTEINWIPLVVNSSLYYIYSFDPLRVFKCTKDGVCTYAQWPKGEHVAPFDASNDVLRGGSPFILYKWPYYISIGHSQTGTMQANGNKLLYGSHIIVLSVHPHFRIVYVSSPIEVKDQIMKSAKITRQYTILKPFLFPVGVILRSPNVLDFSAHLSDTRGYVFRLKGVEALMQSVMDMDKNLESQNPSANEWEPRQFRYTHLLVAKDLSTYHRIMELEYPRVVENEYFIKRQ